MICENIKNIIFTMKHQFLFHTVLQQLRSEFFCSNDPCFVKLLYEGFRPFDGRPTGARQIAIDFGNYWEPYLTYDSGYYNSSDNDSDSDYIN